MLRLLLAAALLTGAAASAASSWVIQASQTAERLRGVSAASDTVAWASGNKGTVVRTADCGATWSRSGIPGADALDFRDIEAFGADTAYVLAIGPGDKSRIYKTEDGGRTWALQFANPDSRAFSDAIAFWDAKTGIAVGDPVDGRFTVIRTVDGGRTWNQVPAANIPEALPGDGAFAASGTCLVGHGSRHAGFGSGLCPGGGGFGHHGARRESCGAPVAPALSGGFAPGDRPDGGPGGGNRGGTAAPGGGAAIGSVTWL